MKLPLDDVGPGWASILKRLDVVLAAIDPNLEVFQVKEKFGGLRVYVGTSEGKYFVDLKDKDAQKRDLKDNKA